MNNVNLLCKTLKPNLKWHGARLSFLALFLIASFRVKTVNLSELSTGFMGKVKIESNYKRLQRFLREFDLDYYVLVKLDGFIQFEHRTYLIPGLQPNLSALLKNSSDGLIIF